MKLQIRFNMLNNKLLDNPVQHFIRANLNSDLQELALKGSPFHGIQTVELLQQIQSKLKCHKKLPTWFNSEGMYYPDKLNIEQTSSEATADFKRRLVSGGSLFDLTGGFGVDSYYFSKQIDRVVHCECDEKLSEIVMHNFKVLNRENISCLNADGLEILRQNNQRFDWIYLDPSRRDDHKKKRVFVQDCTPDVSKHLEFLFKYSNNIMVKLSPMLDIQAALSVLPNTENIYVMAVKNEVKELLFILKNGVLDEPKLNAVNLNTDQPSFEFLIQQEQESTIQFNPPLKYLYEPNSAVLKAGGFKSIARIFGLSKLDKHTHLYTSNSLVKSFPGKVYRVRSVLPYQKKQLKRQFSGLKATLKTRHFPKSVNHLKSELKTVEGDDFLLLFTSVNHNKMVLVLDQK